MDQESLANISNNSGQPNATQSNTGGQVTNKPNNSAQPNAPQLNETNIPNAIALQSNTGVQATNTPNAAMHTQSNASNNEVQPKNYQSKYRTHLCNQLNLTHVNQVISISGWVAHKRDHGNLVFIDLRDNFGITQVIFEGSILSQLENLTLESVITITGIVKARDSNVINKNLDTGEIEVRASSITVESFADHVPFEIYNTTAIPEDLRLKYRFLDLRRDEVHQNILLRSRVTRKIRDLMHNAGFTEFQTPILTSSSPEGARDFLVPSRLNPGKFYALPQAPQQFKQLLMVSGFDKYFQIAPCFRDEDARADRSPGEFYQLDIEMSFVEQEDVFRIIEPIIYELFKSESTKSITYPFKRITYDESMLHYGTDKPDLRNPLIIQDVTNIFFDSNFTAFINLIKQNYEVRAIKADCSGKSRAFFDQLNKFAQSLGLQGLGYIQFGDEIKGPIAKFLTEQNFADIKNKLLVQNGDTVFFICAPKNDINKFGHQIRSELGLSLDLIDKSIYEFVWVTDFPFFELDKEGKIDFSHNPFSMPQCSIEELKSGNTEDLLKIKAFQYDIVCNGIELSSGAIRNHKLDVLYTAFGIVGYSENEVNDKFPNMVNAFKYGAPPHGGIAPGLDRIVMLLAGTENIREVIAFPLNQQGRDLMMNAPNEVCLKQLQELNLKLLQKA